MADRGAEQITLPFPAARANYARERFIVAESNEAAWRAGEAWANSSEPCLVICGPEGAGKTHLAHILAMHPNAFQGWRSLELKGAPDIVVFDDIQPENPRALLAAVQAVTNSDRRLVLTGRGQPGDWSGGLKDLRTRLEAMPRARLELPDEHLLRVVLRKAFTDRQVEVSENVIEYVAPRISRSFAAALQFAALADEDAVRRKEKISVNLARRIVAEMAG